MQLEAQPKLKVQSIAGVLKSCFAFRRYCEPIGLMPPMMRRRFCQSISASIWNEPDQKSDAPITSPSS